ncbi:16S rRNA (adenine(1518)-N(6)/adenine(1519)-N(6))-dimethyltransferase RsmA [Ferrimicrobium sp.]|uniref:16S rRNA (adenine(1518)-N(6)/adenine(1519)-N(6))- dimethyltransferase RsmA n=1 Tax=Ferrimicrobium sp. TaxID=2926050 RepID=UPI0027E3E96A|nr:16S rRNA (adenine(1518)-N(6)/adenine(1519)-N(6))-dimethyltransferase RsmA [Ferrimicrobium sp.]
MTTGVSKSELHRRLFSQGFEPSRALGQNFLVDANIARKIAYEASIGQKARAIEVGPGAGSLTVFLAEYFEQVLAVEADRALTAELQSTLMERGITNVEVVNDDILAFDFIHAGFDLLPTVVVGNLPYNIASQIILRVLERAWYVESVIVMVQAEMADRLLAPVGSRNSSAFGVHVALMASTRQVLTVPASVFVPPPKVGSKVIRLDRVRDPLSIVDPRLYDTIVWVVRLTFGHRRQMLRRALTPEQGAIVGSLGIAVTRRPESLLLDEWIAIGRALEEAGLGAPA